MALWKFLSGEKQADLLKGLEKTRQSLMQKLTQVFRGKTHIDEQDLDAIEEILIGADVGTRVTAKIIDRLQTRLAQSKTNQPLPWQQVLKEELIHLLNTPSSTDHSQTAKPYVILVVGVNGVGKTTTIGKLAFLFRQQGKKVVVGAADTFRAAASDQLAIWAERAGATLIKKNPGTDPAAVAYDTVCAGIQYHADVVLIDTAGRLHNKVPLMNELAKVRRVIQKVIPDAPHETLLVLDASTGQNAVEQTRQFTQATHVTALALTKLDGTAKGGVILAITDQFALPVKYIGVGEKIHQLQPFDPEAFIESLFDPSA